MITPETSYVTRRQLQQQPLRQLQKLRPVQHRGMLTFVLYIKSITLTKSFLLFTRSTLANLVRSTTRTSLFRTTTTTTTTPASVILKDEETDGEEDPQIIKELISLIKKAGGLEQLEKHFIFNTDDAPPEKELSADPTVSTLNKNKDLYQRVLNKALALNLNRRDKNEIQKVTVRSTSPTYLSTTSTDKPVKKEYSSVNRNSRPRPQNDGIDQLPEYENSFKEKPKYVTLVRNRGPNLNTRLKDEDEDPESGEGESKEQSNSDIEETTSRIRYIDANVLRSLDRSRQKETKTEEAVEIKTERPSSGFSYSTINRQKTRTSEAAETPESSTLKYKTIERTRGSTVEPETQEPDRGFGDSRYKYIGEEDDDSDEFVESEIITVKPLQYATINRGSYPVYNREVEESKTETPEAEVNTSSDDEFGTVNPKVSETIFIVTKPFTESPQTTQRLSVNRATSTVSERLTTTPTRTTTRRRQTNRPISRRPSLNLLETEDSDKVEEPPRQTSTRTKPGFRQSSSSSSRATKRPQLLTEETYSDVQSSTVYAPRPFTGSRNRVSNNEIQHDQELDYPTSRPGNVIRSSSRGTARFTIPTINVLRNANFKNNINNKYIRRGPSKAFTESDGSTTITDEELSSAVPHSQSQTSQRTRTTRRRLISTVQSTRDSTVVTKDDQEPLSINNFLVPDRAINPNNRFSLSSKFGLGARSTARPIVDEVFDIDTANPSFSTSPKAFSYVSAGFGLPTKVPGTPFPSKADINEDTVILTLGGQLAVSSPAQNSLQQRINDELAKINTAGSVSDVSDDDLLDTVAPYSVTISSLNDEINDEGQTLGIQQRTTEAPVPTTLRPSRFRVSTQTRTTIAPDSVDTTDRSPVVRRRPVSRTRTPAPDSTVAKASDDSDKSTSRGSTRRPSNIYDRTSRGSSTAQPSTFEYSTPAVTTVDEEEEEQITQTIARLLSTGVPSKYTQEDYTTISESFTTEAIPTTIIEKDEKEITQKDIETTILPVTTTTEAPSSPRSRRIKKIRLTRPTKTTSVDADTKNNEDAITTRRRLAATRSRTSTEASSTTFASTTPSPRLTQSRSRSRGTIKRLVKKRPVTTTKTTPYEEDKEELYEDVDLDINIDNNIQKQSTGRFSDPQEVSRPTRRFQVTRERNDLVSRNEVQEDKEKVEIRRPVYATRTPITRPRVVPSRTTETPVSEEQVEENHDAAEEPDVSNESDGILDDDDFTVSNKEILSSIGISRPTLPQRPAPSQRPSLRPVSRFSVRPRPAADLSESQRTTETSDNKSSQEDRRSSSRRPASYRQKSNRPSFGRTQSSTTETPAQPLATRSKNANIFQRTRVRNYPGRFKAQSDEKKETENEIETITIPSLTQETKSDDDDTFTTLIDEIGNRFTITDGKLTTLRGKRPFETTRIESASTTTPRTTTLMHVFAVDDDDLTTPKPTDPSEQAEEISKRLEKLVEINVIEEINTRTEKHKYNKKANQRSNSSEIFLEKLPTNHKVGEISRLAVIKLMHGTTESDEIKKARILSSDAIFKVETSTIPLERLFELEREAKEIRETVPSTTVVPRAEETITPAYLVTNTEESDPKTTLKDSTPGSTVTTTTEKPATIPSLLSLLRPDDKDPLVISIANLDKVTLQKVEPSQPSITSGYSSSTTN